MVRVGGRQEKTPMMLIVFWLSISLLTPPARQAVTTFLYYSAPLRSLVRHKPESVHVHRGEVSPLA